MYLVGKSGVTDLTTGKLIEIGSLEWNAYKEWVNQGNDPESDGEVYVDDSLIVITSDLLDLKAKKKNEIQAAHDAELYTSFKSSALGSEKTYSYSKKAAERLEAWLTVVAANPDIQEVNWFNAEDGEVTHTRAQFIQVCMDAATRANVIEHKQIELEDQVDAATTPEEVLSISW